MKQTMETPSAYLPIDRLHAISHGRTLPDRSLGTALFADISGFTRLTEALMVDLGANRGAEELTRSLNLVYDSLVAELHRYGGSVISFAGDAITCWFDAEQASPTLAAHRAATCALAMQRRMQEFTAIETPSGRVVSLAMKASIAAGPARRFVVGDPDLQLIDILAGALLDRLSEGEHHASRGETLLDQQSATLIGDNITIAEWRMSQESGERFGVLDAMHVEADPAAWSLREVDSADDALVRPWLLGPIAQRLASGQGEFLAELRPAVVIFLRFDGIDYDDDDDAEGKLNTFVQDVQHVLARYGGALLQIAIGDKGSYLYACFGAPQAHEDDAIRAVSAALELRALDHPFIHGMRIGLSQGRMRTGAYGGAERRTYGAIGDAVNVAARLMQAAAPGQILASDQIRRVAEDFTWDPLPPLAVKGKSEPLAVFAVRGARARRSLRIQEARYALPMVGRRSELGIAAAQLGQVLQGSGQIICMVGEAGTGKSRLMAEVARLAEQRDLIGYGGGCESYRSNTSYLVWHTIWQSFFEIDPSDPADVILELLEAQLAQIDPTLVARAPLLDAVLNVTLPESELTATFDAKLRKVSLESLLIDCVRWRANQRPILFLLEDCHWLDALSHELLEVLCQAITELPVLIMLAYRPPQLERLQAPRVTGMPHCTMITLTDFSPVEAEELIRLKLAHIYGAETSVPAAFAERIMARAQGNPFYVEELLNYLKDRGFGPGDSTSLDEIELPNSLHSLILSRIDQLTEQQQVTLKIASIIGRLFRAALLWDVHPQRDNFERLTRDLEVLNNLELTMIDPEPEQTYLFKHIVTQEVAYESLPYATRALIHDQIGAVIEQQSADMIDQVLDILAYHYSRGTNREKQREYLLRAGERAQADYANNAAIDYYERVLPLTSDERRISVTRRLAQVFELLSQWDAATTHYQQAMQLATQAGDRVAHAWVETAFGELLRKRGQFAEAAEYHARALMAFKELNERTGIAQVLHYQGTLASQRGDRAAARQLYEASLAIRRELDDKPSIGSLLSNLGIVARLQGDLATARALHEEGLAIRRETGNRWAIANSLNNLGNVLLDQDDQAAARQRLDEAVQILRELGDRWALANSLNNLGNVARNQRDLVAARHLYEESLQIYRTLGDRWAIAYLLDDIGVMAVLDGAHQRALCLVAAATILRESIGSPLSSREQAALDQNLQAARAGLSAEGQERATAAGRVMSLGDAVQYALSSDDALPMSVY
jgi:adenylate cyclase